MEWAEEVGRPRWCGLVEWADSGSAGEALSRASEQLLPIQIGTEEGAQRRRSRGRMEARQQRSWPVLGLQRGPVAGGARPSRRKATGRRDAAGAPAQGPCAGKIGRAHV